MLLSATASFSSSSPAARTLNESARKKQRVGAVVEEMSVVSMGNGRKLSKPPREELSPLAASEISVPRR